MCQIPELPPTSWPQIIRCNGSSISRGCSGLAADAESRNLVTGALLYFTFWVAHGPGEKTDEVSCHQQSTRGSSPPMAVGCQLHISGPSVRFEGRGRGRAPPQGTKAPDLESRAVEHGGLHAVGPQDARVEHGADQHQAAVRLLRLHLHNTVRQTWHRLRGGMTCDKPDRSATRARNAPHSATRAVWPKAAPTHPELVDRGD